MSHLLHDYTAQQLAERLQSRKIVVWYDEREDFRPFIDELSEDQTGLCAIEAGGVAAKLAIFSGSMFELRFEVEPVVSVDDPEALLIYLPGISASKDSPLMELEKGGTRWEPRLKQVARNALKQRYTDGVIDELLGRDTVTYDDIAKAFADGEGTAPSVLKSLLSGSTSEAQLANWLAQPDLDEEIVEKEAAAELGKLVQARLQVVLEGTDLAKWRAITVRFVLAVEFRADLAGDPPSELSNIPAAIGETQQRARQIAELLRSSEHRSGYPALADQVQAELSLSAASVDPLELGSIDTFRFEERALLARCADLIRDGEYAQVVAIAEERRTSFWLTEDVERQAQWEAARLAATLGAAADDVDASITPPPRSPAEWIDRYTTAWHLLDRAQRKLEVWLPKLDDEADERAIAAVRHRYDDVLSKLAKGYATALQSADWSIGGIQPQTSVFDDNVRPDKARVAYFLVDAMRYEMGAELAERLDAYGEVTINPAVGVLPSITTTGMAALMPGASNNYDVVDNGGTLAAAVDGKVLPDLKARKKHLAAVVPSSVDLDLGEVLSLSKTKLRRKTEDHQLIVVRSQEIDFFGEGGFGYQARSVMDTVIDNLTRAVRKLATLGIERVVIASDHGHLYAAEDRDDSMKIDAPGGDKIELHRRCWIGRGGATPAACVRVSARELGNDSELDFVFPTNCGVFRAGGDLSFHHGGPTLQEMVIPVITLRLAATPASTSETANVSVGNAPTAITNRIFSVKLSYASLLGTDTPVMPTLVSEGRLVGTVGMVFGAEQLPSGAIALNAGAEADIGFVLEDDTVESLRIVILDPATDAELYQSPADIPVQLGVV